MLQTYKKMGLAVAACTLLGMAASKAAVTLTFAQAGGDVVATWSGSYDLPGGSYNSLLPGFAYLTSNAILASPTMGIGRVSSGAGTPTFSYPSTVTGSYTGTIFGFDSAGSLVFPVGTTGLYSPTGTMTFAGSTLASLGVASFNNTLAFTGNDNVAGSQQIFVTTTGGGPSAVPEPAGAATALVCCVSGLLIRTRQRRRL
jgi:hypothetical protein